MLIFNKCTNERINVGNQIQEQSLAYTQKEEQKPLVTEKGAGHQLLRVSSAFSICADAIS